VCTVIQNKRGTAPGMEFKKDETMFISMPGVPYEMIERKLWRVLDVLK
jgi:nicotinamide-nucleotide amidase